MLAILDICEAIEMGCNLNPRESARKVLGIDIDIRPHNRRAIEAHPMASRIQMIQGSSVDSNIIKSISDIAKNYNNVIICLDSNHTHNHVLAELNAYCHLVSHGSYIIVYDTLINDMPEDLIIDRPWGLGNNPKTAVWEFLKSHTEFEIDYEIPAKLQITVAPDGYLKRIK